MKIQTLVTPNLLGTKFSAIRNYEPTLDFKTKEHNGFKIRISIQDEKSNAFMETITVKIKNTTPTVSEKELFDNKVCPVKLKNLSVGIWNNELTFSADDMAFSN